MTTTGKIVAVNGNMITVAFDGAVAQNEVGYAILGDKRLMAEIVRVHGSRCDLQVFDATTDLSVGDKVEFSGDADTESLVNSQARQATTIIEPFTETLRTGFYKRWIEDHLRDVGSFTTPWLRGSRVGYIPFGRIIKCRRMLAILKSQCLGTCAVGIVC